MDPFCGSGTIPIEAAMIGLNIAPGIKREFQAMTWDNILPKSLFKEAKKEAENLIDRETKLSIRGYDLDSSALDAARGNLLLAGLEGNIHFQQRDMRDISSAKKYGFIITNPPYGERLEEKDAMPELYKEMGKAFSKLDDGHITLLQALKMLPNILEESLIKIERYITV